MLDLPLPVAQVSIDPEVWIPAAQIRWPSAEQTVVVLEGRDQAEADILRVVEGRYEFRFAQVDDRLVVIVGLGPGFAREPRAVEFLAAHESFHVAAQIYGAKIPVNYLDMDPELARTYTDGVAFEGFYDAIDVMHDGLAAGGKDAGCEALSRAYEELSEDARTYLAYKAFWEWPAEFYSYSIAFSARPNEYEGFRANLFRENAGFRLYTSGVKAAQLLEAKLARSEWQTRVANGQSMLSLLAATYNCEIRLQEQSPLTILRLDGM